MYYRSLTKRVGNAVRLAEVVQVLVSYGFADLVHRAGLHEGLPAKFLRSLRLIEAPSAKPETLGERLSLAFQDLGPTFVKFGQVLSTRPDLLDADICRELDRLQDRVEPEPFEEMRAVIESAFSDSIETLYGTFDMTPCASASIAQVYRATLTDGTPVVVKVQRPKARASIEADLSLMRTLAEWISEHVHDLDWLDPVGAVEEFTRSINRELDFTIEARIIERFYENFQDEPLVFVPRAYRELCSSHVITMDYVDGVRVDSLDAYPERNCSPREVARIGANALARQVFEFHLFHADPHPGNIMVMRNNRIAFLDYGMAGHLEQTDVLAMADAFRAITRRDAESCAAVLTTFTTSGDVENHEAFVHEIAEYMAFEAEAIISRGEVGRAIEKLMHVLRRHKLQLAPRFSLLMKALATIESTAHRLDPELDITPIIHDHVQQLMVRRFAPGQLFRDAQTQGAALLRLGRDLPNDLRTLLRVLRTGRAKVQITHEGLNYLASVIDRASNRLTFGVITGSIIVGSSLVVATDLVTPIAVAGYVIAGILGMALLVSIIRSKNY